MMIHNPEHQARQRVYQLLSSLFAKEVDQAMRDELMAEPGQLFLQQLARAPEFAAPISQMKQVLGGLNSTPDLLELAADYCGLFLVGTKHSASPYASLYGHEQEPTIFGQQHHQMSEFLKDQRLQLASDFLEPADHLAVILAYAGHLEVNYPEQQQLDYLQSQLAPWLDKFVAQVIKIDQGLFYQALAELTQAWIASEISWLQSIKSSNSA